MDEGIDPSNRQCRLTGSAVFDHDFIDTNGRFLMLVAAPCAASLQNARTRLNDAITLAIGLVQKGEALKTGGTLSNEELSLLYEACFLQMFCEFESFLECCILDFMTGSCCISGAKPVCYVRPIDRDHATKFVLEGKQFVQYCDFVWLRDLCNRTFQQGGPIVAGLNTSSRLPRIRAVRNRIAHLSDHSDQQFKNAVIAEMTAVPPYILRPGDFLKHLETKGRHRKIFFERFADEFANVSDQILNALP